MTIFPIKETVDELIELEKRNPTMAIRLRWLRALKGNPNISPQTLANQIGTTITEIERWANFYQYGGIELLLNSQTTLERPASQGMTFSEHAEERMLELFNDHPAEYGRRLWIDFEYCRKNQPDKSYTECPLFGNYQDFATEFGNLKKWSRTDCISYIQTVIRYGYEKIGRKDLFQKVNFALGTKMAANLVSIGWKAYLFMPDAENPFDGNAEHTQMYKKALNAKTWWDVPLSGLIVNYRPTTVHEDGSVVAKPTILDGNGTRKLNALANVKFAACVFTKGIHTAILSRGKILEVHWLNVSEQSNSVPDQYKNFQKAPNNTLYQSTKLIDFDWLEGVIVIPADSKASIV